MVIEPEFWELPKGGSAIKVLAIEEVGSVITSVDPEGDIFSIDNDQPDIGHSFANVFDKSGVNHGVYSTFETEEPYPQGFASDAAGNGYRAVSRFPGGGATVFETSAGFTSSQVAIGGFSDVGQPSGCSDIRRGRGHPATAWTRTERNAYSSTEKYWKHHVDAADCGRYNHPGKRVGEPDCEFESPR